MKLREALAQVIAFLRSLDPSVRLTIAWNSLLATAAVFVVILAIQRTYFAPAPYEFSEASYPAIPSVVCPGEAVSWSPVISINRAPLIVDTARTIWNQDTQSTEGGDGTNTTARLIYLALAVVRPQRSLVVPNLAPGHYEIRIGWVEYGSEPRVYTVPFTVQAGCP